MISIGNRRLSSFTYLNITQFLGALNDNIYKLLIIYFFIELKGIENSHIVLATSGAIFVLPFLLFSSFSGTLADRFSKRNVIVYTKVLEVVIMTLGFIAFYFSSQWFSYLVLFLMAMQSALFSPSKYGILPELVPPEKISKANGVMTSFTFLAIIIGTFFASFILDITDKNFIFASILCIFIAFVGMCTSFGIQRTIPSGSKKRFSPMFFSEIYKTLKKIKKEPSLLAAVCGSSFFLFVGAYMQLNIIPFAVQSLHLTDVQGGYLFLCTALGIGLGSVVAGKISGKTAELGLVPLASMGITLCFYFFDIISSHLYGCIFLSAFIGFCGGIYLVPLECYIQIASPKKYIGQIIGTESFLGFIGVLFASIILYIVTEVFGLNATKGFAIVGTISLITTGIITFQFFDYVTRFIGMVLSRLHFKTVFFGQNNIPDTPAIYVCSHSAWNDTLLLLGSQRLRIRFFIQKEQDHSSQLLQRMYRLLRIVFIPEIEPIENNLQCWTSIRKILDKGISVCIFTDDVSAYREMLRLKNSDVVNEVLSDNQYPMLSVFIEKGQKSKQPRFFTRILNRFRVPAAISFASSN